MCALLFLSHHSPTPLLICLPQDNRRRFLDIASRALCDPQFDPLVSSVKRALRALHPNADASEFAALKARLAFSYVNELKKANCHLSVGEYEALHLVLRKACSYNPFSPSLVSSFDALDYVLAEFNELYSNSVTRAQLDLRFVLAGVGQVVAACTLAQCMSSPETEEVVNEQQAAARIRSILQHFMPLLCHEEHAIRSTTSRAFTEFLSVQCRKAPRGMLRSTFLH